MFKGYLDAVTSAGLAHGWAFDPQAPWRAVQVLVVASDGREVAQGTANGFREDLVDAGCGSGWCAFSLRLAVAPWSVGWQALTLLDAGSRQPICRRGSTPYEVLEEPPLRTLEELVASDPTTLRSLDQLRGCEPLFNELIKARGAEVFVRAAYLYLLGRPADTVGLKHYVRHLQKSGVTSYRLLRLIADSEEYRSQPRQLSTPVMPGFPFRLE